MKTIGLFLCFLFIPVLLNAQENKKEAAIGAANMNVLYRGVDNPVEIVVQGISSDKLTATVSDGTIKKTDKGWFVAPGSQEKLTITVSAAGKKVAENSFRVKSIPNPVAKFGGRSEGSIDKESAVSTMEIVADLTSFDWDLNFKVVAYKFVCHKAGFVNELAAKSNRITDQIRTVIRGLNSGDKFGFEDILAVGPDGKIRSLNSILLSIE